MTITYPEEGIDEMKLKVSCIPSQLQAAVALLFAVPLLLVMSGCSQPRFSGSDPSTAAPTVSLTASPTSIAQGSSSTLTLTTSNALSVTLSGSDGTNYTMAATGGTQVVTPATTTTYTATVTAVAGQVSAQATISVAGAPTPPTVGISANPTSITPGSSSTLTIKATNATTVKVSGSDGTSFTLAAAGGTQAVSPAATTTYTASATGPGGSISASATVMVAAEPAPTVSISAAPASITPGASSTLTVAASNATSVTVSGSDGSTFSLAATGGTHTVTPSATTTYTASATGAGGKASAGTTVTVAAVGAPTVSISATPALIAPGGFSTLNVQATNATSVTVTGTDGSNYPLSATGGTQTVLPTTTTTYTATATGAAGKTTATTTITVAASATAPTVSITSSASSITSGGSDTLTVTASNATQLVISGSDGSSYTLPAAGGTQVVSPMATTSYTATATGVGGTATAMTTVLVNQAATPTVSIAANPATIASGGSSTLSVTAVNATQVVITGSDGTSYTLQPTGGNQVVKPTATTTYTATATGVVGRATAAATVTVSPAPTVTITANPTSVVAGNASTLTVTATNATQVTVTGTDGSSYTLAATGGTQSVSPATTTTYTATATGPSGTVSQTAVVTIVAAGSVNSINHVVFMLQENHSFDNYFGMLNPYRRSHNWNIGDDGKDYEVDGIDDKLTTINNVDDEGSAFAPFKLSTTCVDDESSDWLASYGDVNRYNFLATRPIVMDGFVHDAEGYAKNCASSNSCSGSFTDLKGQRAMGYYDQGFLNYYYYMASQFAISNRWFSPMSSKSIPNRIANMSGGTTQGLVLDPGSDDHLSQLAIPTIFQSLDAANVTWKIYYTVTDGYCLTDDDCGTSSSAEYPATTFSYFQYSYQYLYENPTHAACSAITQASSVVGDASNSFCIDTNHIAPISQYFTDLTNGTLPAFSFIEAGYANNDEHPGSGQSILSGQAQVANVINSFMNSPEWNDSVFFLSYDEGGGPYDHVPPVPGHSNDNTDASLGSVPDISTIAVNPDAYNPCVPAGGTATLHCDLSTSAPGAHSGDAAATQGFGAQLGFRVPNMVISPFTRRHYVSNIPMDHTAVIKFVEDRFIGPNAHLTARDAAQPNLLDFFDFNAVPWATPPTPPAPVTSETLGYNPCTPGTLQ
jgi:phospholipase C